MEITVAVGWGQYLFRHRCYHCMRSSMHSWVNQVWWSRLWHCRADLSCSHRLGGRRADVTAARVAEPLKKKVTAEAKDGLRGTNTLKL